MGIINVRPKPEPAAPPKFHPCEMPPEESVSRDTVWECDDCKMRWTLKPVGWFRTPFAGRSTAYKVFIVALNSRDLMVMLQLIGAVLIFLAGYSLFDNLTSD
jgi:hypothetical protein